MTQVDADYSVVVDGVDKRAWHDLMLTFDDAAFYQTWSYGAILWGETRLSHLRLIKDGQTVAMAQLRIARIPMVKAGVAYLTSGPLWRRRGEQPDLAHLRNMVRALRQEYVGRRGFVLQILPRAAAEGAPDLRPVYQEEGFSWSPDLQQTIYVDLKPTLDEILMNARKQWRQTLHRAEKQPIKVVEGNDEDSYLAAEKLIDEMKGRKKYVEYGDMKAKIAVHRDLPGSLKLKFFFCYHEERPVAVLCWFPVGTVGLPLIAATSQDGLALNASYPLFWRMIEYYKEHEALCCDLGGINRQRNPGGYVFKAGLAGKTSEPAPYIGQFEAWSSAVSFLGFKTGLGLRSLYRNARQGVHGLIGKVRRSPREN